MDSFEKKVEDAVRDTESMGAMEDADAVGTAGSEDCGDMLRMWVKFREEDGRRVIDRASFQTFGCQTALAVASAAAKLIRGRTAAEALQMSGEELAAPLGALPPMKIHCAQLVETALQEALREDVPGCAGEDAGSTGQSPEKKGSQGEQVPSLMENMNAPKGLRIKIQK